MLGKRFFLIIFALLTVSAGVLTFSPGKAEALGISPPFVKNDHLLRGSHFEQTIYINQGAPKENLMAKAEIILDHPEHKKWITIKPGLEFMIPVTRLFPITVVVDIPENAEVGTHCTGEIKITTFPEVKGQGQVSVGIGLAIALDLTVTEQETIDYDVALWRIVPMEHNWPLKLGFTLDNRGNGKARPQKVVVKLESRNTPSLGPFEAKNLTYVDAFKRGEIIAEFPVKLAEGAYFITIQFYKTDTEVLEFKSGFDVLPEGSLPRPPKPWWVWASIGFGAAFAVIFIAGLVKFRRIIFRILMAVPLFFLRVKRKFGKIVQVLKEKE